MNFFILICLFLKKLVYGEGPEKVIFICGYLGSMDNYARMLIQLVTTKKYQVCIFNHRGFVYSTATNFRGTFVFIMHKYIYNRFISSFLLLCYFKEHLCMQMILLL